jgi:hypothetical protein
MRDDAPIGTRVTPWPDDLRSSAVIDLRPLDETRSMRSRSRVRFDELRIRTVSRPSDVTIKEAT